MEEASPPLATIRNRFRLYWLDRSLQLTVLFSVILAFVLSGIGFLLIQRGTAELRAREALRYDLMRYTDVLSAALRTPLWELSHENAEAVVKAIVSDERFLSVTVTDGASSRPFVTLQRASASAAGSMSREEVVTYEGERVGSFVLVMSLSPYMDIEQRQFHGQLIQLAVVLPFSMALIVFVFRRRLIKPLEGLTRATERIAAEDLTTPIALDYEDELGRVAKAMDGMRVRLLGVFEELRRKNEALESLNDLASDWTWEQDEQFRFVHFSTSMERIIGLDPTTLVGKVRWGSQTTLSESEWAAHRACLEAHESFRDFEYGFTLPDGEVIYMSTSGRPVFSDQGVFCGYRGTGKNVTERKRWEKELVESEQAIRDLNTSLEARIEERTAELAKAKHAAEEASLAKSTFLANMSHEIRTPMNAIIGLTHILRREFGGKPAQDKLDKIGSAAQHLLTIINDILDLSKIEAGKLILENRDFDIDRVLRSVADMVRNQAAAKDIELIVDTDHLPPTVHGDGNRLGQILLNFVGNAVKFTERGRVLLRCRIVCGDSDSLTIRFDVNDTGIGISAEQQAHLFEAFEQADVSTTRKYGGTGLGLAICKRLATLMNGSVGCTSEVGRGSNFWVEVPLLRRDDVVWPQLPQEFDLATHILVVDDLPEAREPMLEILSSLRLRGEAVISGEAALAAIVAADQAGKPFDLVFVDWRMPGMDGFETARRIGELVLRQHPRLVMVSAASLLLSPDELSAAGFSGFLAKPVTPSSLFEALLEILSLGAGDAGSSELVRASEVELAAYARAAILLVEDNPTNRLVAIDLLGAAGLQADTAEDGAEALEKVQQRDYDLILMDMQMPRMDGLEATRQIRLLPGYATVPIVAMTANAFSADRERCLEAGMNDHIAKPVDPERLYETLLRYFRLAGVLPDQQFAPQSDLRPNVQLDAQTAKPSGMPVKQPLAQETARLPEPQPEDTIIDWRGLEQRYAGRIEFVGRLLHTTLDYFRSTPQELDRLIAAGDFDGIGRIAHGLKSTGGNLMATRLRESAQQTDSSVRRMDAEGLTHARELRVVLAMLLAEGDLWLANANRENRES